MRAGNERPINGTAGRVVARGEHFEYQHQLGSNDSPMPLPVKEITPEQLQNPSFIDFTGATVGRLRVVGLSATKSGRWVCRCVCGTYTMRHTKALKSGGAATAPCDQCYLLACSKKREAFRRTGKHADFLG